MALGIDEIMIKETPANWLGDDVKTKVVLNNLYKVLDKDRNGTEKLFELVKTIPKYFYSHTDLVQNTYQRVLTGEIDSDEGAIFLNENGVDVTNYLFDELRDAEYKFRKKLRGLQTGDIITVKGKNGNKEFFANFRGFTNDGKLVVVYDGGNQMTINADEYY